MIIAKQQKTPKGVAQNKNKKKQNTSSRRRPRTKSPSVHIVPHLHLSPCAQAYAMAKLNPFGYVGSIPPCVPDFVDIPSYKFSTLMRGVFVCGTAGLGYVAAAGRCYASNVTVLHETIASYASATVNLPIAGVTLTTNGKFPYPATEPRNCRTVAMGLRARYIGTELNRGGRVFAFNNSNYAHVEGMSISGLASNPSVTISPNKRQWIGVSWNSSVYDDYSYSNVVTSGSDNTKTSLLLVAQGAHGDTYEYEVVTYYEATSSTSSGGTAHNVTNESKSDSDPVGYGSVKDYLGKIAASDIGSSAYQAFLRYAQTGAAASAASYFAGSQDRVRIEW